MYGRSYIPSTPQSARGSAGLRSLSTGYLAAKWRWTDGTLLVKYFLTHDEYDKNKWCKDCTPRKDKS